jgi:hypothetical protein
LNGMASERLEYLSVRHAAHHKFRKSVSFASIFASISVSCPRSKKSGISKPLSFRRREMFSQWGL